MSDTKPYAPNRAETAYELYMESMCVKYKMPKPIPGEPLLRAFNKVCDLIEKMDDIIEKRAVIGESK